MFLSTFLHGKPAFGPSCTEFVYPGSWHFENGATRKIDDVLTEHGGLLHVLPLAHEILVLAQGPMVLGFEARA